ncbi:MAG: amidohydrolase [Desulfurococcales archaeon ex4484_58]|nr:MAG: amidohydrolase [Desulfurococcales archaeon ex4484_58]
MTDSILIRNVKLWFNDFIESNVLVENGVVREISKREFEDVDLVIDGGSQVLLPGGIDIHAHIYDPEYVDHEDWGSGSLASLYGGLTTVYDMPLRVYVDNVDILKEKIGVASRDSYVNFGIIAGFMNRSNIKNVKELADHGVRGFKVFTARPFKPDENDYLYILDAIKSVDGVAIIHAEDDAFIDYGESKYRDRDDPLAYHMHRSGYAEASAILRIGYMGLETETHIHIAHLSSGEGVYALKYLKSRGAKITAEVCPHHLFFTREDSKKYGGYLKLAPTLKTKNDVEELWRALANGLIDAYVSDNAPSPRDLKEKSIWEAWGGIPNLEIMIPFLYTYGVKSGRLSFDRFIKVIAENPAKIMGIYPRKGTICIGCDADLVVIDTRKPLKYKAEEHHHKVDWSPWDGFEFYGYPIHVLINGKPMIIDRELIGRPGSGKYIYHRSY